MQNLKAQTWTSNIQEVREAVSAIKETGFEIWFTTKRYKKYRGEHGHRKKDRLKVGICL